MRPNFRNTATSDISHILLEFGAEDVEHPCCAILARYGSGKECRAANHHRFGAKRERLDDVCTASYASVEQYRRAVSHGVSDAWQNLKRRHGAVQRAPTVIRNRNAVHSAFN